MKLKIKKIKPNHCAGLWLGLWSYNGFLFLHFQCYNIAYNYFYRSFWVLVGWCEFKSKKKNNEFRS